VQIANVTRKFYMKGYADNDGKQSAEVGFEITF